MATLALTVAGAAAGGALLPAGVSFLGATLSGAMIGSQIGALAGSYVDQALFGSAGRGRAVSGPRLSDLQITASTEGAAVPRLFGRARLGGQVIWATDLEEESGTSGGGGGSKGAPSSASGATRTDYRYFANFAVAICEGPVAGIGRVWADGAELDLGRFVWRPHRGTEEQEPDSLIAAREGAEDAPAYRGIAYIVFERMALADFGNRLPQLSFEVLRQVDPFAESVRGVVMIPGSGEFVYATEPVSRAVGAIRTEAENTHTLAGATDWEIALDQLADALPNARSTSLVVSWFGTDLRAGHCQVRPAVDSPEKDTAPISWSVAGLDRATAPVVSSSGGAAAYGGTPSDQTVIAAIRDLKARGHRVLLTPFILMDIPSGNALPDPYSDAASQPAYPWRGRITVAPAPGRPGSPDKTPAAAAEIAGFVGTATPGHFNVSGDAVAYSGPAEWTLRRMLLHYAHLAVAAGGVDAIVIGTELRGLTEVRSDVSTYPFVDALVALAADVKSVVGSGTKVAYAADWSEYFGHHPDDGSGDVHFHLDPLWASSDIDAVAIDCYWPLADWRDGDHLDRLDGARSSHDLDYLKSNIFAGEGFDWYYASPADRDAQIRTPITDGAAGKPWMFRFKDIRSWWASPHFDRPGGIESEAATAWVPQSKPIWLTEIGCPAVDNGANQPNVFVDPKSAESALPYFSRGERDDLMQRRYLQAICEAFDPDHPGYVEGANPLSDVYGGRMLDLDHVHLYAWDARPYPAFPVKDRVWTDAANWPLGHWLNGRVASQPLGAVIAALLADYGFSHFDVSALDGLVAGLVLDRPMSAREALQPLELAHFLDAVEAGGSLRFQHRGAATPRATLTFDDLVETKPGADLVRLTRGQETDLPAAARLTFSASGADYRQAVVQSRRLVGASGRVAEAQLALVMDADEATRIADAWLFEAWVARERARFTLPPSALALDPGDLVTIEHEGRARLLRVIEVGDHGAREIEALGADPGIYRSGASVTRPARPIADPAGGPVLVQLLDLPLLTGTEAPECGYAVAARAPWPSAGAAIYRSPTDAGFTLAAVAGRRATVGVTLDELAPGPQSRLDMAARLDVRLHAGTLQSTTRTGLLAGANAAAIRGLDGEWEVIQFETATLIAPGTYRLATLLRGQAGTEAAMRDPIPAGASFVLLDASLTSIPLTRDDLGLPLNWRHGPADRNLGDAAYRTTVHAFRGLGLRPLSPVHIRARRSGGDIHLSWVRRTRIGGDSWTTPEVPLAEEAEVYAVDILSGETVVRTLEVGAPTAIYTTADQNADFGAPQTSLHVAIAQVSAAFGRGTPRAAVV